MEGDKLARGARSATFSVAPNLKFDEGKMRDDLRKLDQDDFITKYMVTEREYVMLQHASDEKVSTFAEEMKQRTQFIEDELQRDAQQDASLNRDCFLVPYVPIGLTGRVIVSRDYPVKKKSNIALPKSMRKDKTLLPTTGHIIKARVYAEGGSIEGPRDVSEDFIGLRVLFGQMSGTDIAFKGYPTWVQLDLSEIMAVVLKEDADVEEIPLEPMV